MSVARNAPSSPEGTSTTVVIAIAYITIIMMSRTLFARNDCRRRSNARLVPSTSRGLFEAIQAVSPVSIMALIRGSDAPEVTGSP